MQRGFWWSHMFWFLAPKYDETPVDRIRDFHKFPELRWLNEHFLIPPVLLGVVIFSAFGLTGLIWAYFVPLVLLWHCTFTINSLSHVFGKQRYRTIDTSRNNWFLAILTLGEGWHNNHHYFQSSVKQGFYWWEVDVSYYVLWSLSKLGIVRDLKVPPHSVLEKNRVGEGDPMPAFRPKLKQLEAAVYELTDAARGRAHELSEAAQARAHLARVRAHEMGESAKTRAHEMGESAKLHAHDLGEAARAHARDLADRTRMRAEELAEAARTKAHDIGVAATHAVDELVERARDTAAELEEAAERMAESMQWTPSRE